MGTTGSVDTVRLVASCANAEDQGESEDEPCGREAARMPRRTSLLMPTSRRRRSPAARTTPAKDHNGSSVTRAFEELRGLIVRGNLPPGAWIVESEIAERLGLSRTPIRGALQWLHREGYVVEHKGPRKARIIVAPLTRDDARELYMMVGHLERLAGTLVVAMPAEARTAIANDLAALNAAVERYRQSAAGRSPARLRLGRGVAHANCRGQRGQASGHACYKSVRPQVERYWRLYASSIINELHVSVAEHDAIIRAIRKGDEAAVHGGLARNWSGGFERISRLIEIFGERGSW